jgi:uncharacterized protein YdeI (BOF family)
MKRAIGLVVFAAIVGLGGIGGQSYAIDPYPYYDQDQLRYRDMNVPTGGQVIEGDVTRVDPDSYVIRDLSGRDVRVYFEPGTMRDNITVGDHVIVRFDRPSAPYATSIVRRRPDIAVAPAVLPRPQTIEGEVLRVNSDNYVIRDLSGRDVRLHVDGTTKLDGNLTPGDKVIARVVSPPADHPYAYPRMIYKLNGREALEGQVVAIDGNTYVVRDINGVDHRFAGDSATAGLGNIVVGDYVVVVRGNAPMAHAESISKR